LEANGLPGQLATLLLWKMGFGPKKDQQKNFCRKKVNPVLSKTSLTNHP